jgi:hypothetical protein
LTIRNFELTQPSLALGLSPLVNHQELRTRH